MPMMQLWRARLGRALRRKMCFRRSRYMGLLIVVLLYSPTRSTATGPLWLWCLRLFEVVVRRQVFEEVALLLHDAVKLVHIDSTIPIAVSLVDHVLQLLIVDGLTKLLRNTCEVLECNLGAAVVVEELEHLFDVLARVLLTQLARQTGQSSSSYHGATL